MCRSLNCTHTEDVCQLPKELELMMVDVRRRRRAKAGMAGPLKHSLTGRGRPPATCVRTDYRVTWQALSLQPIACRCRPKIHLCHLRTNGVESADLMRQF